jgi:hypothetical protein
VRPPASLTAYEIRKNNRFHFLEDVFDRMSPAELRAAVSALKARFPDHTYQTIMDSTSSPQATTNFSAWYRGKFDRASLEKVARDYLRRYSQQASPTAQKPPSKAPTQHIVGGQEAIILVYFDGDYTFLQQLEKTLQPASSSAFIGRSVGIGLHENAFYKQFLFSSICQGLGRDFESVQDFYDFLDLEAAKKPNFFGSSGILPPVPAIVTAQTVSGLISRQKSAKSSLALAFHHESASCCRFFALWLKQFSSMYLGSLRLRMCLMPVFVPDDLLRDMEAYLLGFQENLVKRITFATSVRKMQ